MALVVSLAVNFKVLLGYLVWVLLTRTVLSIVLFFYAGRIYVWFPFLLYGSQVAASVIKVYLLFRVSKQRWLNRGDQRSKTATGRLLNFQNAMAGFLTALYIGAFVFVTSVLVGIIDWQTVTSAWSSWLPVQ
jgi:glycosyltransferase Alg8